MMPDNVEGLDRGFSYRHKMVSSQRLVLKCFKTFLVGFAIIENSHTSSFGAMLVKGQLFMTMHADLHRDL